MKPTADEVIRIARTQVGYYEKRTNAHLYEFSANKGSNNWCKYSQDTIGFWGNKTGQEWCTSFVLWVLVRATYPADKESESFAKARADKWEAVKDVQPYGKYGASCKYQTNYYKSFMRWSEVPHKGDQAFFTRGHTGIVESYDGKTLILIEGNSNNKVERRAYSFPNAKFSGFGRPYYAEEVKPVPTVSNMITHTVISSDTPEKIARKYNITTKELLEANKNIYPNITIDFIRDGWKLLIPYHARCTSTNGLNIRENAGTSYKKLGVLKYNDSITVLEEKNGWARHTKGWSCLNWLKKV